MVFFYWFLQREFFLYQTLNRIVREMVTFASEARPDLRNTLIGPANALIHRISSNVSGHDLLKDIKDLGVAILRKLAAASRSSRAGTLGQQIGIAQFAFALADHTERGRKLIH